MSCCCKGKGENAQVASLVGIHGSLAEGSALQEDIDVEEEAEEDAQLDYVGHQQAVDRADPVFTAVFERRAGHAEEPLGMIVDHAVDEKTLHICEVDSGGDTPISRHNKEHPERQIRPGDYFMSLDPMEGKNLAVHASVCRPLLFDVLVETEGQDMGLYLTYSNTGRSLRITNVSHGAALHAEPKLRSGDRIVGVGSVEGKPAALMDAIKAAKSTHVLLRISRPRSLNRDGFMAELISV